MYHHIPNNNLQFYFDCKVSLQNVMEDYVKMVYLNFSNKKNLIYWEWVEDTASLCQISSNEVIQILLKNNFEKPL